MKANRCLDLMHMTNESNDIPSLLIDAFSILIVILKLFNHASVFDTLAVRMGLKIVVAYNLLKLR